MAAKHKRRRLRDILEALVPYPQGLENPEELPQVVCVYVLHFKQKRAHAGHYVGWTTDARRRVKQHRSATEAKACQSSKFMAKMNDLGIQFVVAGIWPGETIEFERYIKDVLKNTSLVCPICRATHNVSDPQTHKEAQSELQS